MGAGRLLFVYAKCGARVKVKAKAREVLGVLVQPCTALRGPIRPAWGSLVRSTTESGGGVVELSDKVLPILQGPAAPPPPFLCLVSAVFPGGSCRRGKLRQEDRSDCSDCSNTSFQVWTGGGGSALWSNGVWGGGGVMNLEGSCWQVAQLPPWVRVRDLLGLLSLLFPRCLLSSRPPPSCHFTCPCCINLPLWQEPR